MTCEPMPEPPEGFAACRTLISRRPQVQITHLVRWVDGGTPGPTMCGLSRFNDRDEHGNQIAGSADLPGWSMGGGLIGSVQVRCDDCWDAAE